METNSKTYIILFYIILSSSALCAQKRGMQLRRETRIAPDTIFVFDTLFVTDTIRLAAQTKKRNPATVLPGRGQAYIVSAQSSGMPGKYLFIFPAPTATIPSGGIIDSDFQHNKKTSDSMKKIGFWGVALFAFQNMVLAQHNIYVKAGTGLYRLQANTSEVTRAASSFSTGLGYTRTFLKGRVAWSAELNYHYLLRSDFDRASGTNGWMLPSDESFTKNYHMFALPLALRAHTKYVQPGIGAAFYYKLSPRIAQVLTDANGVPTVSHYRTPYHGLAWFAGLNLPVSPRLKIGLHFLQGITEEYKAKINIGQFRTKMQQIELSASRRLR